MRCWTLRLAGEMAPIDRMNRGILSVIGFYEKVIKVKADVAAFLINCFPSA
jgi:hypothetical protein